MNTNHNSPTALALRRRGFTFIELMIAMALMAMIMTAAALAINAAGVSRSFNAEQADLVARARGVLDRIARDMRTATAFDVTDPKVLSIDMPDGSNRTYQWDGTAGGNLSFVFTSTGSVIDAPVVLTNKVKSFEVTDAASPACNIAILLQGTKASAGYTITATPRKTVY